MRFEFSAGGVVYKTDPSTSSGQGNIWILLAKHSQHHGWVFPKGLIGDSEQGKKETKEEAAVREVKEETGIEAEIEQALTPVTYWYNWEGEKVKKTVYYFVMAYLGGDMNVRDNEMEEVEWLPFEKVEERLTYPSDKKVWTEAMSLIATSH